MPPCEIKDWKAADCVLVLEVSKLSSREPSSSGEGGALNANYRTVEAVAMVVNLLGCHSFEYGKHFRFKTGEGDRISFDFCNELIKETAEEILAEFLANTE